LRLKEIEDQEHYKPLKSSQNRRRTKKNGWTCDLRFRAKFCRF